MTKRTVAVAGQLARRHPLGSNLAIRLTLPRGLVTESISSGVHVQPARRDQLGSYLAVRPAPRVGGDPHLITWAGFYGSPPT